MASLESTSASAAVSEGTCSLKQELNSVKSIVEQLTAKNDDLENRSRRNNVIFHGISKEPEETNASLLSKVSQLITDELEMECPRIERCHRLGKGSEGRPPPTIIKLLNFNDKIAIMKSARNIEDPNVRVTEDFTARVHIIRKKLWEATKSFRDAGTNVRIIYDHVFIDNVRHDWDNASNCLIRSNSRTKGIKTALPPPGPR